MRVSRRSMLRGSAGFGLAALFPSLLSACGNSDANVLAESDTPAASDTTQPTTAPETTAPETTAETSASETTATVDAQTGTALPPGGELAVAFTYSPTSRGKDLPPYIAVWVEDASGNLVDTVAVWYQQDQKGPRWLPDLKRWFSADQQRIDAGGQDVVDVISGATRLAGSYSVVWDGLDANGSPVPAGDYFVAIESARERGPYSLILEPLALTGEPTDVVLADENELVMASVTVA